MPKDKSHQVDYRGLQVVADEITGKNTNTAIQALTAEATANGSDATTTQALANALKVKVNAIIAALKA